MARTASRPTRRLLVTGAAAALSGCVALGNGQLSPGRAPALLAADSSNNSSDSGSGNSSQGSADSSKSSGDSSKSSADSSKSVESSNNSSAPGGSSDLNASSQNSSANSSKATGQNSSGVVAGSALLGSTLVGVGFAIYGTVRLAKSSGEEHAKTVLLYLRANGEQLRQDLALGAGPTLDDLAAAAEVRPDHRPRFLKLLQRHRRELLALADLDRLTAEGALSFLSRIGELALADPILEEDCRDWLARHPEVG